MITATALTVSRGERVLFRDLSFHIAPGEAVALTGANGAGKTTLLRTLAGFIRPDAGTVAFADIEPAEARATPHPWPGHLDGRKTGRRARGERQCHARLSAGHGRRAPGAVRVWRHSRRARPASLAGTLSRSK